MPSVYTVAVQRPTVFGLHFGATATFSYPTVAMYSDVWWTAVGLQLLSRRRRVTVDLQLLYGCCTMLAALLLHCFCVTIIIAPLLTSPTLYSYTGICHCTDRLHCCALLFNYYLVLLLSYLALCLLERLQIH
jgi:hypothetical protein